MPDVLSGMTNEDYFTPFAMTIKKLLYYVHVRNSYSARAEEAPHWLVYV